MRKSISVLLAAAIIAAGGILAYAMSGHGGMHGGGSSDSGSHMMQHSGHDDESMQHGDTGHHEMEASREVSISEKEAKETIDSFMKNNFHGYEVGKVSLSSDIMMGLPLYRAPVTLADGTEGAIFIDASTGKPVGILLGEYEELYSGFHQGGEKSHEGEGHMMEHGSEGESKGHHADMDSGDEGEEEQHFHDH